MDQQKSPLKIAGAAASAAFFLSLLPFAAACGCDLALASYYITPNLSISFVVPLFNASQQDIAAYSNLSNADFIVAGNRLRIPFTCGCNRGYPSGEFRYAVRKGETYTSIARNTYANLTTATQLQSVNSYPATNIPDNSVINVVVNCSCGDVKVNRSYGLFETYPLLPGDSLRSVAQYAGLSGQEELVRSYNPGANFSAGNGIVFIPAKDLNGSYLPILKSKGLSGGGIAGIIIAVIVVLALLSICLYFTVYKKRSKAATLLPSTYKDDSVPNGYGASTTEKTTSSAHQGGSAVPLAKFTVDKSVEFSYEELANATNDFSMSNKIGSGGFGTVYYAELRGEKVAIKKMDMEASREFLAELKVLTHVHHLNLVRLIGYCTEGSLFLVYEFIENGNLSEHLRGIGREPLPWSARVQIALDSARGLEYIHEHTVPVYIHRDIKSANILIDKNFRAKVADFGLAKLTEVGSSMQTRLVGTFGYMPPEYAQYGDVSPKVDVYAFGVVLYELISAKEAVMKLGFATETRGLVAMFEDALMKPDSREELRKLVDPRLRDNYPVESVYKLAQLAKVCTQERPEGRPNMRSVVVALMTLSSSTEDWDVGSFYESQGFMNLMSGR